MTANAKNELGAVLRTRDLLPDSLWNNEIPQHVPRCFRRLVAVERPFARRDFAISDRRPIRNLYQHDAALLGDTKAGLKRIQKLHSQLAHLNLFDKHQTLLA